MTRYFFLSILFVAFSWLSAYSSPAPDEAAARDLFGKGEYLKAAGQYLELEKAQGSSAGLLYNIANCYAEAGDLGNAMLYYSRASRLDPSDKTIRNNLSYFASKVEDSNRAELKGKKISVAPDPETFFSSLHRIIALQVSSDFWAFMAASAFILMLAGIAAYLFCDDVRLRKTGFFGAIVLFFVSVTLVVFAFSAADAYESHDRAVLMAYKSQLRIEPSSDAKPAAALLCQGTRFVIVAEESGVDGRPAWYKVRLNADIEGWIKADEVEII